MAKEESTLGSSALAGTDECAATALRSRISIVRASEHRSIDISVETTTISSAGRKRSWPVQIFNL
jgi:type I protein arginine methyltransferase